MEEARTEFGRAVARMRSRPRCPACDDRQELLDALGGLSVEYLDIIGAYVMARSQYPEILEERARHLEGLQGSAVRHPDGRVEATGVYAEHPELVPREWCAPPEPRRRWWRWFR